MVFRAPFFRYGFSFLLATLTALSCFGQTFAVSDSLTLAFNGGETQSTVVPPNVNSACVAGRFLASNDRARPPQAIVSGRDLGVTSGQMLTSTFDSPKNVKDYDYVTNDHDLVVLPNGHILYATGAASGEALSPKPAWFDVSQRGNILHGARSNLMVWRSLDCGKTFTYLGEFDPAKVGDGSCALPQWFNDTNNQHFAKTTPPPSDASTKHPYYSMGGSDGQLVKVDPQSGKLYLTFECVGYLPDTSVKDHFALSQNLVNKTLLATSSDEGATWSLLGTLPMMQWRLGLITNSSGALYLGAGTGLIRAQKLSSQAVSFGPSMSVPGVAWGWNQSSSTQSLIKTLNAVAANMWGATTVSRVPDSEMVLIAIPTDVAGTHGFRVFVYDPDQGKYAEQDPIIPQSKSADDATLHLVAVESGGAVLLYWTDLNFQKRTATVRGRVVFGSNSYTGDIQISQSGGKPAVWSLKQGSAYWYGDYQTAAGYTHFSNPKAEVQVRTSEFYPVWVQPDNAIHYARVQAFNRGRQSAAGNAIDGVTVKTIARGNWKVSPLAIQPSRLPRNLLQLNQGKDHEPDEK